VLRYCYYIHIIVDLSYWDGWYAS